MEQVWVYGGPIVCVQDCGVDRSFELDRLSEKKKKNPFKGEGDYTPGSETNVPFGTLCPRTSLPPVERLLDPMGSCTNVVRWDAKRSWRLE